MPLTYLSLHVLYHVGEVMVEKWLYIILGITVGFLAAIILLSVAYKIDSALINIIAVCLVAIAAIGSWFAAWQSAQITKRSYDYMTSLDQPMIELINWDTYIVGEHPKHTFIFTLKIFGKETVILKIVHLTFFYMWFKQEYTNEKTFNIELNPNRSFKNSLTREIPLEEKIEGDKIVNPDDEKTMKEAELKYACVCLFNIQYKRKSSSHKPLEKKIPLYYFFGKEQYRLLSVDDYNRLKDKIPASFKKKIDECFCI